LEFDRRFGEFPHWLIPGGIILGYNLFRPAFKQQKIIFPKKLFLYCIETDCFTEGLLYFSDS
jgi:hypothetical protein